MSVTLMAPDGLYADALSTAAFVLGPRRALQMFERIDYRAEAVMVDDQCRMHATPGTDERLQMRVELDRRSTLPECD